MGDDRMPFAKKWKKDKKKALEWIEKQKPNSQKLFKEALSAENNWFVEAAVKKFTYDSFLEKLVSDCYSTEALLAIKDKQILFSIASDPLFFADGNVFYEWLFPIEKYSLRPPGRIYFRKLVQYDHIYGRENITKNSISPEKLKPSLKNDAKAERRRKLLLQEKMFALALVALRELKNKDEYELIEKLVAESKYDKVSSEAAVEAAKRNPYFVLKIINEDNIFPQSIDDAVEAALWVEPKVAFRIIEPGLIKNNKYPSNSEIAAIKVAAETDPEFAAKVATDDNILSSDIRSEAAKYAVKSNPELALKFAADESKDIDVRRVAAEQITDPDIRRKYCKTLETHSWSCISSERMECGDHLDTFYEYRCKYCGEEKTEMERIRL